MVQSPNVKKIEYELIGVCDGYFSLMDAYGSVRNDIRVLETDMNREITTIFQKTIKEVVDFNIIVVVIAAMGREAVKSYRIVK